MKKLVMTMLVLLVVALGVPCLAQAPAPTPKLNTFEVYLGGGQMATWAAGNFTTYKVNFETSIFAGFRWFPTEKLALDVSFTHDSAKLGYWLVRHNFIAGTEPTSKYSYGALAPVVQYWVVRNTHGGVYAFAGPDYFFGTGNQSNKLGLTAGFGGQWAFGHFFVEGSVAYLHVQDFLVPVANTDVGKLAFGWKF